MRALVISRRPVFRAAISMILMSRWPCSVTEAEEMTDASRVTRRLNATLVVADIDASSASSTSRFVEILDPRSS